MVRVEGRATCHLDAQPREELELNRRVGVDGVERITDAAAAQQWAADAKEEPPIGSRVTQHEVRLNK
eukprot:7341064-Prymnesium_polylepis.1